MKKLLFSLLFILCCLPVIAQPNQTELVPVGDGSYRIVRSEDEDPTATREKELAERAEAARWAGVLRTDTSKPSAPSMLEDIVVETAPETEQTPTSKTAPKRKNRSYLSIGISGINTTVRLTEESARFWSMARTFEDTNLGLKGAFGAWMSEHARAEIFFQKRGDVALDGSRNNFDYSAKVKMWDLGANAFLYPNPNTDVRFFIGAGIAASLVRPKLTLNGTDINDTKLVIGGKTYRFELFESKFCLTPSGFAGVEFPVSENIDMDITAFYSYTRINQDGLDSIKSFGLTANIRFNSKRK